MEYNVFVTPSASQCGVIDISDDWAGEPEDYVVDHWEDIIFSEVDLDYSGAAFSVSPADGEGADGE